MTKPSQENKESEPDFSLGLWIMHVVFEGFWQVSLKKKNEILHTLLPCISLYTRHKEAMEEMDGAGMNDESKGMK